MERHSETTLTTQQFVHWFRNSSPYIKAFRNSTFVIVFDGGALQDETFSNIVNDIALLNSLGIRLVLVHGARPQIEQRLCERGAKIKYVKGVRVTDPLALECVKDACGTIRVTIEALLSMGLANSPMAGARLRAISGNFVTAHPVGIHGGVDYQLTGKLRRIDTEGISRCLDNGNIVILPPLGYSPTGEVFNLTALEVARAAASALKADKLICMIAGNGLTDEQTRLIRQMTVTEAEQLAGTGRVDSDIGGVLDCAIHACRNGVQRAHLVSRKVDGALLMELFSRDGIATMITADIYEGIRTATIDDIPGILKLVEPLERKSILVRRSREHLETGIDRYTVIERDGMVIACVACYPFIEERIAELACLAVHPEYQNRGYGAMLLQKTIKAITRLHIRKLFVLTTQASHWFQEKGFCATPLYSLPLARRQIYNYQRGSRVYLLNL